MRTSKQSRGCRFTLSRKFFTITKIYGNQVFGEDSPLLFYFEFFFLESSSSGDLSS